MEHMNEISIRKKEIKIIGLLFMFLAGLFPLFYGCHTKEESIHFQINKKYPKAEILEIEKDLMKMEVEFLYRQEKYEMTYDLQGNWLKTELNVSFSRLPVKIIEDIQTKYRDWDVDDVVLSEKKNVNEKQYEIELEQGRLREYLIFSANGLLINHESVSRDEYEEPFIDITAYKSDKNRLNELMHYQLNQPDKKYELPANLFEISGIKIMQDNTIACVQDELGSLFFYNLEKEKITNSIKFSKPGDYEGIAFNGNIFFVLRSDATLFTILSAMQAAPAVTDFRLEIPFLNNEGLYFDDINKKLMIASKSAMINDKQKENRYLSIFNWKENSPEFEKMIKLEAASIKEKLPANITKLKFNPSAIAVHPVTGNIYILSANTRMLVVCNWEGNVLAVSLLDPEVFNKPEGISFYSNADMLISNEGHLKKNKASNLLLFYYR